MPDTGWCAPAPRVLYDIAVGQLPSRGVVESVASRSILGFLDLVTDPASDGCSTLGFSIDIGRAIMG